MMAVGPNVPSWGLPEAGRVVQQLVNLIFPFYLAQTLVPPHPPPPQITTNSQTCVASLYLHCRWFHFREEGRTGLPVSKSLVSMPGMKVRTLHVPSKCSVTELHLLVLQASL